MSKTMIDLLRHGEPEGGRMYRGGGTDHPLSDAGWQQMHQAVAVDSSNTEGEAWSAIVTSPMLRSQNFAQALAKQKGIPCEVIENLREAGYGSWEGRRPQEIKEQDEEAYWQFFADPVNSRPENAEPLDDFSQRISEVLNKVLQDYQGQHILLVSHLAVMRAMIGTVLDMPLASQQLIDFPFAGRLRLINDRKGLRMVF